VADCNNQFETLEEAVTRKNQSPERTIVYEATNTYVLVGLEIRDPAHSLESIAATPNAGLLWLENATAGDAAVMAPDPACPEGRVVATGLVDTDHQDVESRSQHEPLDTRPQGLLC
jgi:hypothetical protein